MIEVNLLPGGRKRAPRAKRRSLALPKLGGLAPDKWVLGPVVLTVLAMGAAGWLFLSLGSRRDEAEVALTRVLQDSARYADLMVRTDQLMARRDSIIQRVAIIQEIDQGRYVWPHVLDEVARALPDYTWVNQIQQVDPAPRPRVRISGESGNIHALTVFMDQLEGSPFLRGVRTTGTSQFVRDNQLVYRFELELEYEQPAAEFLETVPLFGPWAADLDLELLDG